MHRPKSPLQPPVELAPLLRAARFGGPLAAALARCGHEEAAPFAPPAGWPTHDDDVLGRDWSEPS